MEQAAATPGHRIEAMVAQIGAKGDFPAAARVIQRLYEAVRQESCGALEVARIIHIDPGVSSKVLRVVNSAFYRPRGDAVSTVTRAVVLLGFEAIRDITTGLLLLDQVSRTARSSVHFRRLLQRCLGCGLLARALSLQIGYPTPEEAYLLGLFANWGTLCLAAYCPLEFEQAHAAAKRDGTPVERAIVDVFGFSPSAFAAAILEHWNFPVRYVDYFRVAHGANHQPVIGSTSTLFAVVALAADYMAAAPRAGSDAAAAVLQRYTALFGRVPDGFAAAVRTATDVLREQAPLLGLEPALTALGPAAEAGAPDATSAAGGKASAPAQSPYKDQSALGILSEITRAILEHEDINDTLSMVLEGIALSGRFDLVVLALLSPEKDRLVGRLGYGEGLRDYLKRLSVPLTERAGVLAQTVLSQKPRVEARGSTALLGEVGRQLPPIPVRSFIATPLIVRGKAIGALLATRSDGPAVDLSDLTLVQLFANQAGLALARAAS
jgi:HD-like signal output (HDOD) protein